MLVSLFSTYFHSTNIQLKSTLRKSSERSSKPTLGKIQPNLIFFTLVPKSPNHTNVSFAKHSDPLVHMKKLRIFSNYPQKYTFHKFNGHPEMLKFPPTPYSCKNTPVQQKVTTNVQQGSNHKTISQTTSSTFDSNISIKNKLQILQISKTTHIP